MWKREESKKHKVKAKVDMYLVLFMFMDLPKDPYELLFKVMNITLQGFSAWANGLAHLVFLCN